MVGEKPKDEAWTIFISFIAQRSLLRAKSENKVRL